MREEVSSNIRSAALAAFVALCAASALAAGGCSRTTTGGEKPLALAGDAPRKTNAAPPVRVSAEKTEAAEPAAAPGREGTVYVAWVEHRGKQADVWLAHFDGEGRLLGT